jgi:hypothetical protein
VDVVFTAEGGKAGGGWEEGEFIELGEWSGNTDASTHVHVDLSSFATHPTPNADGFAAGGAAAGAAGVAEEGAGSGEAGAGEGGIVWRGGVNEVPCGETFAARFELVGGVPWATEWTRGAYVELRRERSEGVEGAVDGAEEEADYFRLHESRKDGFEWSRPVAKPGVYCWVLRSSGDPFPPTYATQKMVFVAAAVDKGNGRGGGDGGDGGEGGKGGEGGEGKEGVVWGAVVHQDTDVTRELWGLISKGSLDALTSLLAGDPSAALVRTKDGRGPLFWAYEYGRSKEVELLKGYGADEGAEEGLEGGSLRYTLLYCCVLYLLCAVRAV